MIKLSSNKQYLVDNNNKPFFWLGDTAWELIHRLTKEEIILYLDDRKKKGFNIIQTVILAELDGLNTPNAYGNKPLIDNDPTKINDAYFEMVDFVLNETEKREMLVGLLPSWGDKVVKKWGMGPLIFTPENSFLYGEILGKKYKNRSNIIWIAGGDRIPETEEHRKIFEGMAKGIRKSDPNHLISYHPLGTEKASDYFNEPWLDIDMFQSGHDNKTKEYRYVEECRKNNKNRPIINGESRYENIGNAFYLGPYDTWLDDYDVRVSAYWSILAGAAGYTYGCNDIWQMYQTGRKPVISARTDWKQALSLPGSTQMKYLKDFISNIPWYKMAQNQKILLNSENPENENYIIYCLFRIN